MTTAQDQQSRAEFEREFGSDFDLERSSIRQGQYSHPIAQAAWTAWQAARALPAGIEPAFHGFRDDVECRVEMCFSPSAPRRDGTYATAYYTAAQVLAMLAQGLAPGWQAVPVEPDAGMLDELDLIIDFGADESKYAWRQLLAAAPRPPAAQEDDTLAKIAEVAACFGADWPDVEGEPEVLRRVKWAARQLKEKADMGIPIAAQGKCWCERCDMLSNPLLGRTRMALCPTCGNKRCPRSAHHDNACTGSNAVGQAGSSWEHVQPFKKDSTDAS